MPKRNKKDILADMLKTMRDSGSLKPTHIMYKANLSHSQLKNYLEELVENELVEKTENDGTDYFALSKKGFTFITKWEEMKEFEKAFGL